MPYSKSPLGTRPRCRQVVDVGLGALVLVVGVHVRLRAQADRYLAGAVPQAAVARVG